MPLRIQVVDGDCWKSNYKGRKSDGRVVLGNPTRYLYRDMYSAFIGEPQGSLHHSCGNPWCVNPWHLEDVSQSDHMRKHMDNPILQRQETCRKGHVIADVGQDKKGWCKQCRRDYMREYMRNRSRAEVTL